MPKICTTCHKKKKLSEFYHSRTSPDGKRNQCKACILAKGRFRRKLQKRKSQRRTYYQTYKKTNQEKLAAQHTLNDAIRHGEIIPTSVCQFCGGIEKLYAHHYDYDLPLDIIWLCSVCHNTLHRYWEREGSE